MGLRNQLELASPRWLARLHTGAILLALATPGCFLGSGDPSEEGGNGTKTEEGENALAERSRFPRLSHLQWENTTRDLLHLDARSGLSESFTRDPLGGMFDNNETVLKVTPGLWSDYQIAAEELSAYVTADQERLGRIMPEGASAEPLERARQFIESFGTRAFRRPLTEAEIGLYVALYESASEVLPGTDPYVSGMQLVLQAFLQSPFFVYRVGESEAPRQDGLIPLNGYEIATNLSYFLWNTMPDDDLLAAAKAGELDTAAGVRAYAERMLEDPRAREVVGSFHAQLYKYEHYLDLSKDPALFPQFTPEVASDMVREAEMFVDDVVFKRGGGLTELLTSRTAFLNERTAPIYGVEGEFTEEMQEVELDPTTRSGLLTRIGFLASNATPRQPDTIHRGVFVNLRILCADLPSPPNNVMGLPANAEGTNRDRVNAHTGAGTCGGACHATLINPVGFAFENYDALGQWRTEDNGLPVNAADEYRFASGTQKFENGVALSQVIAESREAHQCYAKHWMEYGLGRAATDADRPMIAKLSEESRTGTPVKQLLLSIVESDAFLTRSPLEAP
ncbi:DUF1592 domain-containing protein [Chondromyces apiculatus]|uniref:Cellulose-binding domain protein n=1 Tax=Chondromyces apiculatus DSM 436 TaxID=1192034 RepID=A0A017T839_9BACT|nr:DUF1592 domain-containing protein [Chondromyces apiculatus]EYF05117.1 Cellulose-binding domain protein [Chondromyces apiculatus DSM 436]